MNWGDFSCFLGLQKVLSYSDRRESRWEPWVLLPSDALLLDFLRAPATGDIRLEALRGGATDWFLGAVLKELSFERRCLTEF